MIGKVATLESKLERGNLEKQNNCLLIKDLTSKVAQIGQMLQKKENDYFALL